LRTLGRDGEARQREALAEAAWRSDSPEPARLAVFLADRATTADGFSEAIAVAEAAARDRHDVTTDDALAWAYFRAGRFEESSAASARATRLGSKDKVIVAHASAIAQATRQRGAR
jgi:hypothetical protein